MPPRGPLTSPPMWPVAGTPSSHCVFCGLVRSALSKVWTTRSPCSPSYALTKRFCPLAAMLEWRLTSRTWIGGSESHSHFSAPRLHVSKMLVGSCSTRILPVGQLCAQEGSFGAGEQRLVAVTQTGLPAFLQPPLQGGSPTQNLLKQLVPSPQAPVGSHFS